MTAADIVWKVWEPEPRCVARRGPRSRVQCELEPGHDGCHIARGRIGQIFTWGER